MKKKSNLGFFALIFVALIWNFGYSQTTASFHSNLTVTEQEAYYKLAQALPHGKVAFTNKDGRIKVIALGDTISKDFGLNGTGGAKAKFVRWSPDGTKLAVFTEDKKVYVMMDAYQNAPLTPLVVSNVFFGQRACPIEFHTNGHEILYTKNTSSGNEIWAVEINNPQATRMVVDCSDCEGEIGISADGNRMVYQGFNALHNGLHKLDLKQGTDSIYDDQNCQPNISPDGSMVMNNTGVHGVFLEPHKTIMIWDFNSGALVKEVLFPQEFPDPWWDNQHWSNNNDWIAAKGHFNSDSWNPLNWGESYVVNHKTGITYRVTWENGTDYPDLWVDLSYTSVKSENSKSSTSNTVRTGVQLTNENGFTQLKISTVGHHEFRVYNILGQLLSAKSGNGPSSYHFPNLRSGLYFIQVKTQFGTSVQKMVIVR
jgi:hypothetical protein